MKKTILFICVILFSVSSYAQEVILEEKVDSEKKEKKKGANKRNFDHLYFGLKYPMPPNNEGSEVIFHKSPVWEFGYRYKFRVSNHYAIGANISYECRRFRLDQVDSKITPNSDLFDEEMLRSRSFNLGLYNRINFDKRRGNKVGNFLDLGAYGGYITSTIHRTEIEEDNAEHVSTYKKLEYMEKLKYGVFANIGFGRYVVTANYRLSNVFKEDSGYPEMPALFVGLQMGLHR